MTTTHTLASILADRAALSHPVPAPIAAGRFIVSGHGEAARMTRLSAGQVVILRERGYSVESADF